jgi:hypothetical protein
MLKCGDERGTKFPQEEEIISGMNILKSRHWNMLKVKAPPNPYKRE